MQQPAPAPKAIEEKAGVPRQAAEGGNGNVPAHYDSPAPNGSRLGAARGQKTRDRLSNGPKVPPDLHNQANVHPMLRLMASDARLPIATRRR